MPFGVDDDELGAYIDLHKRRQDRLARMKQRSLLTPTVSKMSPSRYTRHFMVPESPPPTPPLRQRPHPMTSHLPSTSSLSTRSDDLTVPESPLAPSSTIPRRPFFWPSDTPFPPPKQWWKMREEPGRSARSSYRDRRPLAEPPPPPYIASDQPPSYTEGSSSPADPLTGDGYLSDRGGDVIALPTVATAPAHSCVDTSQACSHGNHASEHWHSEQSVAPYRAFGSAPATGYQNSLALNL